MFSISKSVVAFQALSRHKISLRAVHTFVTGVYLRGKVAVLANACTFAKI